MRFNLFLMLKHILFLVFCFIINCILNQFNDDDPAIPFCPKSWPNPSCPHGPDPCMPSAMSMVTDLISLIRCVYTMHQHICHTLDNKHNTCCCCAWLFKMHTPIDGIDRIVGNPANLTSLPYINYCTPIDGIR